MTTAPPASLYHRWVGWHAPALRRTVVVASIGLLVALVLLGFVTWGLAVVAGWDAAAGNNVLLVADGMEAMAQLGYRPHGCERCADRVREDAATAVSVLTSFPDRLQDRRVPPAPPIQTAAETRDAVVACLRAWGGTPDSPLGPTAIALATAWFWTMEITRLGGELAHPLAAVATAAQSPWWR